MGERRGGGGRVVASEKSIMAFRRGLSPAPWSPSRSTCLSGKGSSKLQPGLSEPH